MLSHLVLLICFLNKLRVKTLTSSPVLRPLTKSRQKIVCLTIVDRNQSCLSRKKKICKEIFIDSLRSVTLLLEICWHSLIASFLVISASTYWTHLLLCFSRIQFSGHFGWKSEKFSCVHGTLTKTHHEIPNHRLMKGPSFLRNRNNFVWWKQKPWKLKTVIDNFLKLNYFVHNLKTTEM